MFNASKGEIAAIILEPIPANAGLYLPEPGFLQGLREMCTMEGALLIFDEVMTGFRLAPGGAQEIYGITPDLTAMGKVIGGGLPVGAFGGRADIMDKLSPDGPVYQAGTLSGNPIAMAAGLAQLGEMIKRGGWSHLEELGNEFESRVRSAIAGKPLTFHRIGSMFCLHFFAKGRYAISRKLRKATARPSRVSSTPAWNAVFISRLRNSKRASSPSRIRPKTSTKRHA